MLLTFSGATYFERSSRTIFSINCCRVFASSEGALDGVWQRPGSAKTKISAKKQNGRRLRCLFIGDFQSRLNRGARINSIAKRGACGLSRFQGDLHGTSGASFDIESELFP